ncbi:MAG: orotate phosphoribosyltransferase [Candidatus Firestonebacteria bacterium]
MITEKEAIDIFVKCGALLNGHFKLTSGLHSPVYFEKFQVLQHPRYTTLFCDEIAEKFSDKQVDVVIGPATGGIMLSYAVARSLSNISGREIRNIFTERHEGKMALRRGFKIQKREKVLIVEDVLTTGGSVREVIDAIKDFDPEIVGIGLLVDRSKDTIDFGIPKFALANIKAETYVSEKCPLCKKNIPISKPGSR